MACWKFNAVNIISSSKCKPEVHLEVGWKVNAVMHWKVNAVLRKVIDDQSIVNVRFS